ncbi:DUF4811 domain-containing protein [Enterococcus florum]|uniref:DUF4811 domain-containing protein n=1 Tax=Enterococcus florum TaxID=2480627 RepID=A0A4V0WP25_9ENTE|nr:DUF4811 domain-containing protein [Enterococcus florum]GCF92379.1 DUF4811 domain-containing protein [Enterococcus florum]
MIFLITILSVLAFAVTNIFAKKAWHTVLSIFFAAIFVVSLGFIIANDHYHFGMKKMTETTVNPLVSTVDYKQANLLLYQPLGNGTEMIYLYKTAENQKKPKTTGTDHVHNHIKNNQKTNQLIEKKSYWVYKSDMSKLWFKLTSKDHELIEEDNTFDIAEGWFVLSNDQAKQLVQKTAENKNQLAESEKTFAQEKLKDAMSHNPSLTLNEQQTILQHATAEFQKESMKKVIEEIR